MQTNLGNSQECITAAVNTQDAFFETSHGPKEVSWGKSIVTLRVQLELSGDSEAVRERYALVSQQQTSPGETHIACFYTTELLGCLAAWVVC